MLSFICGFIFGLVYELLRIIRLILRFRAAVFACDVLFFVLAALAVSRLSPMLGSYIRFYTVAGFGAGIFAYIVTIGRVLNLIESAASAAWRMTIGRLLRFAARKTRKAFGVFAQFCGSGIGKVSDFFGRRQKNILGYLHSKHKMMYNDDNVNEKESESRHVITAKIRRTS